MSKETQDKARNILKRLKKSWGITWAEMGEVFGFNWKSLSVFASTVNDGREPEIPTWLAEAIIDLEDAECPSDPRAEFRPPNTRAVLLDFGKAHIIPVPNIGYCRVCRKPFIEHGFGQRYCTGRRGECGLSARRKREQKRRQQNA